MSTNDFDLMFDTLTKVYNESYAALDMLLPNAKEAAELDAIDHLISSCRHILDAQEQMLKYSQDQALNNTLLNNIGDKMQALAAYEAELKSRNSR